jgi:single-strand DNA-binding protein
MASLNKVMIIGNLGKDPEIRTTPSGAKVANFSVATNESYTDKSGNRVDKTEWHKIVMWKGLAEIAEKYLQKGSTAFFEGKLTTRSWDDTNGQKRYTTEIVVDNMVMLGSKGQGGGSSNQAPVESYQEPYSGGSKPSNNMPPAEEDDLPF